MSEAVLDASALLAILQSEPGAAEAALALDSAVMGTVNLSEVIAKLAVSGVPEGVIREMLAGLSLRIISFDAETAHSAGLMAPVTKVAGLSLGDRACLALAAQLNLPALTADSAWAGLPLGVTVRLLR